MASGDQLNLIGQPLGETLSFTMSIWDPGGKLIAGNTESSPYWLQVSTRPEIKSPTLSSRGTYEILLGNGRTKVGDGRRYYEVVRYAQNGGTGTYQLFIGCILHDGTVINAGDTSSPSGGIELNLPAISSTAVFSGNGFPGLAPVDFSSAFKVPLNFGEPNEGEIPVNGNNVLGFKFKAISGDKMDLSFNRTSGNLNLGLVVLSSTNQVIYMVALVNSEIMSSRFTLPDTSDYVIGVFRLDLLPPAAPINTVFNLQANMIFNR